MELSKLALKKAMIASRPNGLTIVGTPLRLLISTRASNSSSPTQISTCDSRIDLSDTAEGTHMRRRHRNKRRT